MSADTRSPSSASACTRGASGAATSSSTASSPPRRRSADAGVDVERRPVRRRRRHHPQRLPRLRRRRHLRQALGWTGARVASCYAACASGAPGHQHRPGPDPRRPLRRRAGGRRRHHAEGLLRPGRRRPPRRSRLAALPPARRHQPDLLRALRPPPHGALRRHRATTSPRCKVKNAATALTNPNARYRKEVTRGRRAGLADGGRPAAPARDLRHLRRRRRHRALEHGVRPARARPTPVTIAGHLHGHADLPADRASRCPNFATDSAVGRHRRPTGRSATRSPHAAYEEAGPRSRGRRPGRGLRPVVRARARLVREHRPVRRGRGRAAAARRRHRRSAAASRSTRAAAWPASARPSRPRPSPRCASSPGSSAARPTGRQVEGARVGLTVNQGLFGHGSSVIVTR